MFHKDLSYFKYRRHRDHKPEFPEFTADFNSVKIENGHLSTLCQNTKSSVVFTLDIYSLKDNRFRFRFNELNPLKVRYEVRDVIIDNLDQEKYSASVSVFTKLYRFIISFKLYLRLEIVKRDAAQIELKSNQSSRIILNANPLKVEFYIEDYLVTTFNSKNLLKFEHLRTKTEGAFEAHEPDMWEETFKTHTDSKPNGIYTEK